MLFYRIAKTEHIRDLSGTGARLYGGRWNHKGTAMLYASEHRSLAILEFLVHTSIQSFPNDVSLISLQVSMPTEALEVTPSDLPPSWRESPAPFQLAEIGSDWITSGKGLLLKVPSAIVPEERNTLINPSHPNSEKISINSVSSFSLDSRFFKK